MFYTKRHKFRTLSEQKTHLGTKMSKPINKTKLVCKTVIVNRNEAFNHQKKKAFASTAISKTVKSHLFQTFLCQNLHGLCHLSNQVETAIATFQFTLRVLWILVAEV